MARSYTITENERRRRSLHMKGLHDNWKFALATSARMKERHKNPTFAAESAKRRHNARRKLSGEAYEMVVAALEITPKATHVREQMRSILGTVGICQIRQIAKDEGIILTRGPLPRSHQRNVDAVLKPLTPK